MYRSVTLAAAALMTLAAVVPAQAADEEPVAGEGLFLTVSGSENTWMRGVMLKCAPEPGGPHPAAADACAALTKAGGDLDKLPADPHPCTKKFDPVTVEATGSWQQRSMSWQKTYANACALDAATGAVFRF
ncbi:SSI family serine proteinase inhibitor [Streptomyces sp. NPDC006475]|uniref:SSI family serine proteinase inhibitor n=1 Tax=Streptomyces achmelvichensis TaxID=3134111 RepID=A0ACC6PQ75_9ACTN|nr:MULTISPECIES: SSI family serine proteinase inhibitor [unclassified Streptomyces]WNO75929.1 SSI family serine proteinase inhibitor [Streptomyces sp. AM8-1-1]WST36582.1 SSI family serine proteinase inhibitor [Streptomyces sp. NBC_01167]